MHAIPILILSGVVLVAGLLVDALLVPGSNVTAVYALAVVIAALRASPRGVLAMAGLAVLLDVAEVEIVRPPMRVWPVAFVALLMVSGCAFLISREQQRILRHSEDMAAVERVAHALGHELALDRVGPIIVEQARDVIGPDAVAVWTMDDARRELRLLAHQGVGPASAREGAVIPLDAPSALAEVARTSRAQSVLDFRRMTPEFTLSRRFVAREGFRSGFAEPLVAREHLVGVIAFSWRETHHLSDREREMIQTLSIYWAIAIENARLYDVQARHARAAEEARQSLQQFLAMVAHDLREPLTTMLGYAQLLQRATAEGLPSRERERLLAMQRAARQMRQLVDDLLDAARIGAGRFRVQPTALDLVDLARQVIDEQQMTTTLHRLILEGPARLEGVWDRARIHQLLSNLISNAIKYSPRGGDVLVELRPEGGEAICCVTDHGVGIAPEQLQNLFQPFVRVGPEQRLQGAGLGLYIAKGIVEAHRGRIWVESEVGRGTTFCVALPRELPIPAV